jgi:nitrous oxidase accessory protein NosD
MRLNIRRPLPTAIALLITGFSITGPALAAGSRVPPASTGPQTLSGFGGGAGAHEFILQPGSSWKGDLTGIGAGPNLQDADTGSHFKCLGINFYLDATGAGGGTLFQCYQQWTAEGISSHGLNPGDLTADDFDLRFDFTKALTADGWNVTPYFRLSTGSWTLFTDGPFTATVGGIDFDAGKLVVGFDGGADGTLSYGNYYIDGPLTSGYVDDDWVGLPDGTAVLFPGDPDYKTMGVDAFSAVQICIDEVTGSTVNVAAGTYNERLTISKSIDLRGAQYGVDPTPSGARTTPALESTITEAGLSTPNPDLLIDIQSGISNVSVDGFTLLSDPTNPIADTSTLRSWNDNISISNNIIDGLRGVLFKSGNGLTVHQNRMVVNKNGIIIQPSAASNVTFTSNTFALGSSPAGDESAMYMTGTTTADVSDNTATGFINGRGIAGSNLTDITISDNKFTGNKDGVSFWGTTTFVTITGNDLSGSLRYGINIKGQDIDITDNDITSCGDGGVNVDRHVIDTERVTISDNEISGNTNFGVRVSTSVTETVDATCNWWGATGGPNVPPENPSSGDAIEGDVTYAPWLDSAGGTCDQYGGNNVAAEPDGDCLSTNNPCERVSVNFNRTDTTPARAATVTIELSSELVLCGSGIQQGTWLDGFTSTFQVIDNGGGSYTVDQAILGTPCGVATGGELFTVDVGPSGGDGTGTITVTSVSVRDCGDPPVVLAGIPGAPGTLTIDNTLPAAITDLTSTQWKSGNDSDGTTKIDLNWSVVEAGATVKLYRKGYGSYPEYDDGGGSVPTVPTDPGDAVANGWAHVADVAAPTATYTDEPSTRDFWYYVAFVVDACTNVSAVSNLADDTRRNNPGTLNYHLGDVASGGYDNNVKTDDMSELSAAYGSTDGGGGWNNDVDVGPTTDFSTNGRPTTDDRIDFDDLLMFAINFGIEGLPFQGDRPVAMALEETPELVLRVESQTSRELVARLILEGNTMAVKGIHSVVTFDESHLDLVEVTEGALLSDQVDPVFFKDLETESGRVVDMAVLGVDKAFRSSGEVAVLKFRVHRVGSLPVLEETKLRDIHNRPVGGSELARQLLPAEEEEALPTDLRFLGARPNPFSGTTMLVFELPSAAPVKLRIYDVRGRLVRTLMDGYASPGRHNVVWDGYRNDGRKAGVGVYLYTFRATDQKAEGKIYHIK